MTDDQPTTTTTRTPAMQEWEAAWEQNKQAVGRAVHEAWAAEKVRQGFADHQFVPSIDISKIDGEGSRCVANRDEPICTLLANKHHTDMLDYDDLASHIQAYDIETGIVGFRMGYEAAMQRAWLDSMTPIQDALIRAHNDGEHPRYDPEPGCAGCLLRRVKA